MQVFADDSTVSVMANNVHDINHQLNAILNDIVVWCDQNKMHLNVSKKHCMCVAFLQKLAHIDDNLKKGTFLSQINSEKVLGVIIDNMLTWCLYLSLLV